MMMMMMRSVVCINLKLVGAIFVLLHFNLLFSNYSVVAVADTKHVVSISGGCIENERHALLELKASLVLDDTSLLPTWDSKSHDCCAWEGIVCSNQTRHVKMLDLNGDQFGPFRGEINASLMELQHLKHLDVSGSEFSHGIFRKMFGSLSNLIFLDLKSSSITGRIPNDLGQLSHLQYLDLSNNDLEGTIPHQLGNLSHLQYLDLSGNILVGTIPHQLGSLSNLQELNLGFNQLNVGGEWLSNLTLLTHLDLSDIPNLNSSHIWLQMIAKLPKIQELTLIYCDLSDHYLLSFYPSLLNFSTSLTILDLSFNAFSSSKIFEWVFNATSNLTELDLSYNIFKGTIPYDFGNIKNPLKRLDLYGNELQGGTSLESFRDICTLQSLYLGINNLNEDISTILHKFSGCARYSLQDLSLRHNQITGTLPNLSIFPSLKTIDLSDNLLIGKVPDGIPKSLESLRFRNNYLEGEIPKSFGNLCSLSLLDLSFNKLNGDLSVILHNMSVGCGKYSLQYLNLATNRITGTIPDMSGFSSLETLILSDNLLHGRIKTYAFPSKLESLDLKSNNLDGVLIDSHFVNMSMLKYLSLSSNSLTLKFSDNWVPPFQLSTIFLSSCILGPSFPKWLESQKHVQALDISNAQISDVVPVWFWTHATNIRLTNISYNHLTGTIPNLPIRFSEDCQVIMDSNQFEGSIPPFFQSASLLQLSKNKFSDTFLLLCSNISIDRLLVLDLSKNQLSRKLPDCWSHLKDLEFIDLSDNTLSGEVPSSMGSMVKLKVLILRNNSLYGKLPVSLKNCKKLNMLDIGDNRFFGPIPYWLGQQLQMLSLRRNQFNGSLPQSLCDLKNIQLLDLSENNLSGQIFKCIKNFSAMSQNVSPNGEEDYNFGYPTGDEFEHIYTGYDLVALLMWKGSERQFKNNKLILRSIDLSSNQLIGDLPEEIGNLIELVSLNLSSNNFTGEITSKIGRLTSLEFLDLSRNLFSGPIPPSLVQIDRLSMLNLSENNLSGRIPIGTQLQSFDASSYEGNNDLCGKPLDKICPGDEEGAHQKPETHKESSHEDKKPLYLSVALGFITGFWGLWGSLFLIRHWRHKYVLFLDNIIDTMYVFIVLNATKFQVWLRHLQEKFV